MTLKTKLFGLVSTGLLVSSPVLAVDLVGVHDLALKNDPQLQAADFRRQATGENKSIACRQRTFGARQPARTSR